LLSATGIGAFVGAIYMANRSEAIKHKQLLFDTISIGVIHLIAAYTKNYYLCFALMFMTGFSA
jgi:predicted MFS family arabinose efflux permease